jgi:hypothetical protein
MVSSFNIEEMLYAQHVEIDSIADLTTQRGTPIPALFNNFYKFVQNPSSVSLETFKRMIDTDDTIGSGVDFLTTCIAARLGRYQHPSEEVTVWVNNALKQIDGGFFGVVKELLSATWAGFSVQEMVWSFTEHGFIVKKMVTLPPSTVLFETERTGELTYDGILQYQRNATPLSGFSGSYFGGLGFRQDSFAKFGDLAFPLRTANSLNYMSIRIPKQKCVHYAFDAQGRFGNPYGRSLLRRCYKYYVMKDAFLQMMSVALDRKGTPLTIVYADPNETLQDPNSPLNERGRRSGISAVDAATKAFAQIHNDSTIILPGKKGQIFETDFVPQDANSDQFLQALDFCNKSILRSLLIPDLTIGGGDGNGSYSLGQEHARTFEKILDGWLTGLSQVLLEQVISKMLAYNFPKSVWQKDGFGDFSKREHTQHEIEKTMDMYQTAINAGVIDVNDLNDLNKMRESLGFTEKTSDELQI